MGSVYAYLTLVYVPRLDSSGPTPRARILDLDKVIRGFSRR